MEFIKELLKILLGVEINPQNLAFVVGGGFFALLSFTFRRAIDIKEGIDKNEISPNQFSWKYFWSKPSNVLSVFISLTAIVIGLRFSQYFISDAEITMYTALAVGLLVDSIVLWAKNFNKK